MRISQTLFVLAVLFVQTNQLATNGVLALTWTAGFCIFEQSNNKQLCFSEQVQLWDQQTANLLSQSFTIHGLWIDKQSTRSKFGPYNRSIILSNDQLIDKMSNYFPSAIKYSKYIDQPQFLWKHEWNTHGSDFAYAVNNLWPDYLYFENYLKRNQALQLLFFTETIKLYESLKVRKMPSGLLTKTELAKIIGIEPNQFNVICTGKKYVRQIRICVQVVENGLIVVQCGKDSKTCFDKILVLAEWEARKQERVTNYEK